MQAREGAQAAVVPAGAQLVVVAPGHSSAAGGGGGSIAAGGGGGMQRCWWWWGLVGQRGFISRGEGEWSRRMNVILFLRRPLIIKKTT